MNYRGYANKNNPLEKNEFWELTNVWCSYIWERVWWLPIYGTQCTPTPTHRWLSSPHASPDFCPCSCFAVLQLSRISRLSTDFTAANPGYWHALITHCYDNATSLGRCMQRLKCSVGHEWRRSDLMPSQCYKPHKSTPSSRWYPLAIICYSMYIQHDRTGNA